MRRLATDLLNFAGDNQLTFNHDRWSRICQYIFKQVVKTNQYPAVKVHYELVLD